MNPINLTYLAGLFDGEGTISVRLRKSDNAMNTEVTICNTNPEIVRLFSMLLKGHQREQQFGKWKKLARISWFKHGEILQILEALFPYMILKKQQAELMITLCKSTLSVKGRPYTEEERRLVREIRELNRR